MQPLSYCSNKSSLEMCMACVIAVRFRKGPANFLLSGPPSPCSPLPLSTVREVLRETVQKSRREGSERAQLTCVATVNVQDLYREKSWRGCGPASQQTSEALARAHAFPPELLEA